tara:strand:- start:484 stop:633 length:150 start_codon:yes stop_codon:yes gene_type:complete
MADILPYTAPPYTTTERDALSSLTAGAIIYNTTTNKLQVYNGSSWIDLH